jgi:hypothetical protein
VDGELDLGHEHSLIYTSWRPDRPLNPNLAHLPDVDRIGAILSHPVPGEQPCRNGLTFDGPVAREVFPGRPYWTVERGADGQPDFDHLTLTPSVLCRTHGDHGWVRDGRWHPA